MAFNNSIILLQSPVLSDSPFLVIAFPGMDVQEFLRCCAPMDLGHVLTYMKPTSLSPIPQAELTLSYVVYELHIELSLGGMWGH